MNKGIVLSILFLLAGSCLLVAGCAYQQPSAAAASPTPTPMAMNSPQGAQDAPSSAVTPAVPVGGGPTVNLGLTAKNILFNTTSITVPAGAHVVMTFDNEDAGIPHNFAVYTDSTATKKIFSGTIITGVQTTTYTFDAPKDPGNYFFRCDVHPTIMYGTFTVK
jgi:plastocyanin